MIDGLHVGYLESFDLVGWVGMVPERAVMRHQGIFPSWFSRLSKAW